nr:MAG TPA: hypothetical protein [Caudoviricetes sp.]
MRERQLERSEVLFIFFKIVRNMSRMDITVYSNSILIIMNIFA